MASLLIDKPALLCMRGRGRGRGYAPGLVVELDKDVERWGRGLGATTCCDRRMQMESESESDCAASSK